MAHKKSKQQKAIEAWKRLFDRTLSSKDIEAFSAKRQATERMYGKCPGYLWYNLRSHIFKSVILPKYISDTNINTRNYIVNYVEKTLGHGYVNELNAISRKRTW